MYDLQISFPIQYVAFSFFKSSPEDTFIDFRETGREGETERQQRRCEAETLIDCLSNVP